MPPSDYTEDRLAARKIRAAEEELNRAIDVARDRGIRVDLHLDVVQRADRAYESSVVRAVAYRPIDGSLGTPLAKSAPVEEGTP